jgi:hypothetical protein
MRVPPAGVCEFFAPSPALTLERVAPLDSYGKDYSPA